MHFLFSTNYVSALIICTARGRCFLSLCVRIAAHFVAFVQRIVLRGRSSYMQIETHGSSMYDPSQLTV